MKKATDVFGEWAEEGKDEKMAKHHAFAVNDMLEYALGERANIGKNFSFLDLGCGNGWVVGSVAEYKLCERSVGIDGAKKMIVSFANEIRYFVVSSNLSLWPRNRIISIPDFARSSIICKKHFVTECS